MSKGSRCLKCALEFEAGFPEGIFTCKTCSPALYRERKAEERAEERAARILPVKEERRASALPVFEDVERLPGEEAEEYAARLLRHNSPGLVKSLMAESLTKDEIGVRLDLLAKCVPNARPKVDEEAELTEYRLKHIEEIARELRVAFARAESPAPLPGFEERVPVDGGE